MLCIYVMRQVWGSSALVILGVLVGTGFIHSSKCFGFLSICYFGPDMGFVRVSCCLRRDKGPILPILVFRALDS